MFFSPRPKRTGVSAAALGFFLAQYVQVMKHARDRTDARMKEYLLSAIEELGIPEDALLEDFNESEEEEPEVGPALPIIHRRPDGIDSGC